MLKDKLRHDGLTEGFFSGITSLHYGKSGRYSTFNVEFIADILLTARAEILLAPSHCKELMQSKLLEIHINVCNYGMK